jgi:hypothetical protein
MHPLKRMLPLVALFGLIGPSLAFAPQPVAAVEIRNVRDIGDIVIPNLSEFWALASGYTRDPSLIHWYDRPDGESVRGCQARVLVPMGNPKYTPNSSYCFTDSVLYLDHRWLQSLATEYGDYAVGFVIAHEWGHHVQNVRGIDLRRVPKINVELQADCLAGLYSRYAHEAGVLDAHDMQEALRLTWNKLGGDPSGHGTREQRLNAFVRGHDLYAWDACDIFVPLNL